MFAQMFYKKRNQISMFAQMLRNAWSLHMLHILQRVFFHISVHIHVKNNIGTQLLMQMCVIMTWSMALSLTLICRLWLLTPVSIISHRELAHQQ
jgi:hypothetical protein